MVHSLWYEGERRGIQVFHIYRTVSNRHKIDGWGLIRDACRDYGGNGLGILFHRNHYANLIHVYRITGGNTYFVRGYKREKREKEISRGLKTWLFFFNFISRTNCFIFVTKFWKWIDGATMMELCSLPMWFPSKKYKRRKYLRCLARRRNVDGKL